LSQINLSKKSHQSPFVFLASLCYNDPMRDIDHIAPKNSSELATHLAPELGIRVNLPDGRFMYVKTDQPPTTDWHESEDFAVWMECTNKTVLKLVKKLGIEPRADGRYPPLTYELIEQEREWESFYNNLPPKITVGIMNNYLGWHKNTIKRHAAELGYQPTLGKRLYPKRVLMELRNSNLSVPYDEGWLTIHGLQKKVGAAHYEWVVDRLASSPFMPEKRRLTSSGAVYDCYHPDSLLYLKKHLADVPPAGGDLYTIGRISRELGRSYYWATKHAQPYQHVAEWRLDDMSVPRRHYPRRVLDALSVEAQKTTPTGEANGWPTNKDVAKMLGITAASATRKLERLGIAKEKRLSAESGRPVWHYDVTQVESLAASIKYESENLIDEYNLSKIIGQSTYMINKRLREFGVEPVSTGSDLRQRKLYSINDVIKLLCASERRDDVTQYIE
jgi:hypothetical protein